jgi:hypothetical protein
VTYGTRTTSDRPRPCATDSFDTVTYYAEASAAAAAQDYNAVDTAAAKANMVGYNGSMAAVAALPATRKIL